MPFPNIGPGELILILIIALVVLGPGKLPDVAQSLGKSVREFRRAATDVTEAGKLDAPAPSQSAQVSSPPAAQHPSAPAAQLQSAPPAPASPAAPAAAADAGVDAPPPPTADGARSSDSAPIAGEPARDPNLT